MPSNWSLSKNTKTVGWSISARRLLELHGKVVYPEVPKESVKIRYDQRLAWFNAQGQGCQTRMNAVLRSYYEVHKE